jgi:hypothetical protein
LTDHLFSPGPSFPKLSCKDDDFGGKTSSPLALLLPLLLLLKPQLSKPLPLIREERSAPPTENDAHTDEAKPLVPIKTVLLFSIFAPENASVFWRKNSKNATEFVRTSTVFRTAAFPFDANALKKERH